MEDTIEASMRKADARAREGENLLLAARSSEEDRNFQSRSESRPRNISELPKEPELDFSPSLSSRPHIKPTWPLQSNKAKMSAQPEGHQSNMRRIVVLFCSLYLLAHYNLINHFINHVGATEPATSSGPNQHHQQGVASTSSSSIIKHPFAPAAQSLLPKLPKINIYLGRNETKRLLGIDTKINYVSEGNINTYPLGFSIPLGYNQSDMIFTWQNLGHTNVTYSISLALSNTEAVNPPIINITRNGLIPKHEQVFRITLPCSGKFTNEVDVEVFINISGFVPVDETGQPTGADSDSPPGGSATAGADDEPDLDADGSAEVARAPSSGADDDDNGPSTTIATTGSSSTTAAAVAADEALRNLMQSDQEDQQPRVLMRPVSHTLAIKRKKICTMHPVPVQPNTYPPTQPTHRPVMQAHNNDNNSNNNKWPAQSPAPADQVTTTTARQLAAAATATGEQIAGQPATLEAPAKETDPRPPAQLSVGNFLAPNAANTGMPSRVRAHQRHQTGHNGPHQYPNWPPFPPPTSAIPKIAPENPLHDILARQQQQLSSGQQNQHQNQQQQQQQQSFMVPILALLSVLISLALIVVVLLASVGNSSSSFLINKLNALKSCRLLRRAKGAPVGSMARANAVAGGKSLAHNGHTMISCLRADLKSSAASSVSGLSAISGHSQLTNKHQLASYCGYKGAGYSTTTGPSSQYYGHQQPGFAAGPPHYHHPPTADLLGTGYQCQQQQQQQHQQQQPPQYPVYHIETTTANPAQTTRLIWQNGNGTSPDGFTMDGSYMPLSNHAPISDDTGSAYQTIY